MNSEYLTLAEIVDELRALSRAKETGTFFVVSDEQQSAMFGLERGQLVALQCRLRFGERAIPLIANIRTGRCRFDHSMNFSRRIDIPNEEVFAAILSGNTDIEVSRSNSPAVPERSASATKPKLAISSAQRNAIAQILGEELGPIGHVVMGDIEDCSSLDEVISVIYESAEGLGIEQLLVTKVRTILKL